MTDAIAWALVHFLWQGTALALVAAILMRLVTSSSVRYAIGVSTLAAMVIAVGLTAAQTRTADQVQGPTESTVQGSTADANLRSEPLDSWTPGPTQRQRVLPTAWILTAWILGVITLSVRAFGGWWVARRMAREAITPLSDELQAVAIALAQRLGVRRVVGVFESSRVSVPVMIGWLRPVVLMPSAALAGLSVAQVEAIFAHEFAHIRRHDYLVNLLQTAVETMLFFHPAVWWVSREIRRERELCCDDLAVRVSDRLTYATALSALAHLQPPSLALAATDGSLRDRVRRIITNSPSSESAKGGWMAMLPLVLVVSLAAPAAFTQTAAAPPKVAPPVLQKAAPAQPKEAPVVITADKGMVHLKTANGDIQAKRIEIEPESRAKIDVEQLLDEQLALERRRLELAKAKAENESALTLRSLEIDVKNGQMQIEELRKKVAAGVEGDGVLRNWESSQMRMVAKLEAEKRALDLTLMDLTLQERELELKHRMQRAGMVGPVEQGVQAASSARKPLLGNEAVLPGDIVTIVIEGGTGAVRDFTVDAAGSIRHPQLGDLIVGGYSTSGVRDKVIKLLIANGLSKDPTVSVLVHRR